MKDVRQQISGPCPEPEEAKQWPYELCDRRGRPMGPAADDGLREEESILDANQAEQPQQDLVGDGIEEDGFPEPNWN